ncbi:hypothetical protein ACTMTU_17980 [Streptomyces sp. OZ13]
MGSTEPSVVAAGHPVTGIDSAGHYPQLTHPAELTGHLVASATPVGG